MKKVIQVVYNMECGGIEKFIMTMYKQMLNMGVSYDFIYMNDETNKSYYDDEIKKMGGNIYYTGKLNKKNILKFIISFRKIIKNNGPYIALHVHSFYNCGFISAIAKLFGQKNIIAHSHSTKDNKNDDSIKRRIYRVISKKLILYFSDHRLACGLEAGKALFDNSKFEVINNGISIEKFMNINEDEINRKKNELKINKEKVIIHVGNFYEVKNHSYIIDIAKELKQQNLSVKFLLLGDGALRTRIETKVKENDLTEMIVFLGLKSDVEKYLALSDIFILPSKYEGFPISLIEAQAAGLPCIVSDKIDKNTDLKINNFFSIGIKKQDIDIWCEKIIRDYKKEKIDKSIIRIKELSMDSHSSAKKLYNIYTGAEYEKR